MTADPQHSDGDKIKSRRSHATTPEAEQAHAAWEQLVRQVERLHAAATDAAFEITAQIDAALRELLTIEAAEEETRPRHKGDRHPFWAQKVLCLVQEREQRKGRQEKPRTATFCARVLDPVKPMPPDKAWLQKSMADFFKAIISDDATAVPSDQSRKVRRLRATVLPFAQYLIARFGDGHAMEQPVATDLRVSSLRDVVEGLSPHKSAADWAFALGRLNEAIGQEMRQHPCDTADRDARRQAMLDLIRRLPKSKAYVHQSAAKREKLDRQLEQLRLQAERAWHRLHIEPRRHAKRDRRGRS